jgi:hypothetical protein
MSLSLIKSFQTDDLIIRRFNKGIWDQGGTDRGRFNSKNCKTFTIKASVQPLTGNEIVQVPEHRRTRETVKIYVFDRLVTSDEKSLKPADIVEHDGKMYEVHSVENWKTGGRFSTDLPHYKAVATKIDGEGRGY